jgi:ribosomal-protein-alanine N-acetyltransferase
VCLWQNRTSDGYNSASGRLHEEWLPLQDAPTRYNGRVTFRVRAYQKADFETLWRIDQTCFEPGLAYSRFELAVYMRRPGAFTLVAEAGALQSETGNGRSPRPVLGFIVAEYRRKTGHIITIDVVQDGRRRGIGSALLRAAERQMQTAGATAVELETPVNNETAIRFYKAAGYFVERSVRGYYSNQLDALVMRKDLVEVVSRDSM